MPTCQVLSNITLSVSLKGGNATFASVTPPYMLYNNNKLSVALFLTDRAQRTYVSLF